MSSKYLGRVLVSAAGAAAFLVPVAPALSSGWRSNVFQSPTGNILCRYDSYNSVMACMTLNDTFVAAVPLYGRSYKTHGGTFRGGPTFPYGGSWTASGRFRCTSAMSGITCRSVQTGHGFFINRTSYRLF